MNKNLKFLITLGPVGFFKGSGTYASFFTLIIAYICNIIFGNFFTLLLALVITISGFFLVKQYLDFTNKKDPPEVVIDEVSGQLFATITAGTSIDLIILSFIFFRIFDILKPFPINKLENIKGSFGVMADDVFAGILTSIIIFSIKHFL